MSDEEWPASLKAHRWTNCDYQLWFPPSICFNLFKCAEAHFIWIKIDEMARNQLSDIVAVLSKVWLCPHSGLRLSSPSPLASAWLLYIAVSISTLPGGESCRTRLWEICVGKSDLVSLGPGVSERPPFVEPYWTRASWGWGTFCARPDGKVRNDRSSVKLMWHHCAHPFDQVAQLSRRKWG